MASTLVEQYRSFGVFRNLSLRESNFLGFGREDEGPKHRSSSFPRGDSSWAIPPEENSVTL